jgi:hypothetical protein
VSRDWEAWLRAASAPASDNEEAKRDRTESRIRSAIQDSAEIPNQSVRVFAKGSYANNTNVRLDADVDVAVEWTHGFKTVKAFQAADLSDEDLGLSDVDAPTPTEFRDQVERALLEAFGSSSVDTSGNKAVTVSAGPTTLDADVVPCFRMRRYDARSTLYEGIRLFPHNGSYVDNWPRQNYENGVAKNNRTGARYKKLVRCLKRLENEMLDKGAIPQEVHSYLMECLVWNVPNEGFGHSAYRADMRYVLAHTFNGTIGDERCRDWGEVNELKFLFGPSQRWTRAEANDFLGLAWDYMGFD